MNLILFTLVILISFPTILAFADSENDKTLLHDKGVELLQLGKSEEAISYFDKVLEIDPNDLKALNNKGAALGNLGKSEEAISYFDKVLEIDPNHIDALNNKGSVLTLQGKYYEATMYFTKVLTLEPDHERAKIRFDNAKRGLSYKPADGVVEVTIRDDQGRLVAYEMTRIFWVLDHEIVNQVVPEIFDKKVITRNGQDVEVFQLKKTQNMDRPIVHSKWGVSSIYNLNTFILYGHSFQFPFERGDVADIVFTIFSLSD